MKEKTLLSIALLAIVMLAGSCTQNNGHIGRLFGSWVLTARTVDGADKPLPEGTEAYLSFQNNIVRMLTVTDTYNVDSETYGSWVEEGDTLILDCSHTSDKDPGQYDVPSWLAPAEDFITFRISRIDGQQLILERDVYGADYEYTFSKTW